VISHISIQRGDSLLACMIASHITSHHVVGRFWSNQGASDASHGSECRVQCSIVSTHLPGCRTLAVCPCWCCTPSFPLQRLASEWTCSLAKRHEPCKTLTAKILKLALSALVSLQPRIPHMGYNCTCVRPTSFSFHHSIQQWTSPVFVGETSSFSPSNFAPSPTPSKTRNKSGWMWTDLSSTTQAVRPPTILSTMTCR
jgi:hypothetical protein